MTWRVTTEPDRFDEAVEWFAGRFPITEELEASLGEFAGPRAWTIAGVTQLDVVQYVHSSLERAIADGVPFATWQAEVEDRLIEAWGKRDSARLETVFINATQQSYNAGRWEQMNDPDVVRFRPFGMYDAVIDDFTTVFCRNWDGKILPIQEFAQRGACPQTHHRCRAGIRSLRPSEAERRGGVSTTLPSETAAPGFGQDPSKSSWKPEPKKYDAGLFAEYERKRAELEETAKRPLKN